MTAISWIKWWIIFLYFKERVKSKTSLETLQQNLREQKQTPKAEIPLVQKSEQSEKKRKMSFKEKQEFEQIEKELPQLEQEKELLSAELSSGALSNELLLEKGARLMNLQCVGSSFQN